MKCSITLLCISFLFAANAISQPNETTTYSPEQLMKMAEPLHVQADSSSGTATEILQKFPNYYTMLVYRNKSGQVELHQTFVDIMMIVDGHGTLVSGGRANGMKTTAPNEMRGKEISGGSSVVLQKGVVVRVPPNTPHQVLVRPGDSITYFVVKVESRVP